MVDVHGYQEHAQHHLSHQSRPIEVIRGVHAAGCHPLLSSPTYNALRQPRGGSCDLQRAAAAVGKYPRNVTFRADRGTSLAWQLGSFGCC